MNTKNLKNTKITVLLFLLATYAQAADITLHPLQQFYDCSEKVQLTMDFANIPAGYNEVVVNWFRPDGTIQETTTIPLGEATSQRTSSWISLKPAQGAGVFRWLDPSAGMSDFIGPWQAIVFLNGTQVSTAEFAVDC